MREKLAALPRRAPESADPPGVTIPAYIPAQLKALSWLATIGVFYMLWLFNRSESTALREAYDVNAVAQRACATGLGALG